ncbi:MAG: minichromosome maintenance protein MCM [Candidatus Jordarchaeales archaeon]
MAPSIYGLDHLKEALALQLFGGAPKRFPDIRVRGELNVLLIGDPGTAKSQLLQHAARLAPRGLYTSGRGTTAAGLTAAVIRERQEGGMTLEAGALVLADRGLCAIDEIEKMRPEDRVAVHEVMEQHTVSVAKGGIVATLNARTAVLAAANPALGRYVRERTVAENISLPVTILSRFDLIFVLTDVPDKEADAKLSGHVLALHKDLAPPTQPPIPQELLRKYIAYARRIDPRLTDEAVQRLQQFYLEMRSASSDSGSPVAITVRQLESLVRLAEAHARMALRREVTAEDAEAAVLLMRKSMEQVGVDLKTGKFDADILLTGKPSSLRDKMSTVLGIVVELEREAGMTEEKAIIELAKTRYGILEEEARRLIAEMVRQGTLFEPRPGYWKKT